jgi:hypothetical protein
MNTLPMIALIALFTLNALDLLVLFSVTRRR